MAKYILIVLLLVIAATTVPVTSDPIASMSINKFAVKLYTTIVTADNNTNLFISPLSIAAALSMMYAGAVGEEAERLSEVMEYGGNSDELVHHAYHQLMQQLQTDTLDSHKLTVANRLYVQKQLRLNDEFLSTVSDNYKAGLQQVDFASSETAENINSWVSNITQGMIPEVLEPSGIQSALLVVINAVYFKSEWLSYFTSAARGPFFLTNGSQVEDNLMYVEDYFKYTTSRRMRSKLVEFPYRGEEMSMIVILPDNLADLERRGFSFKYIISKINRARTKPLDVTFVQFNSTTILDLLDIFEELDIPCAYSGMTSGTLPLVSAKHHARIKVTQLGTEAAAATSMNVAASGPDPDVIRLHINRPFLYMIVHKPTSTVVFLGRYIGPEH